MKKLKIPQSLEQEFATVELVYNSGATTRRVDALLLSWIKFEKQLRRIFCFLVFQHPQITEKQIDDVIDSLSRNGSLYPVNFIAAIKTLAGPRLPEPLRIDRSPLWKEIQRIKKYRNKLMHGQMSGSKIKSSQLEQDTQILINWVSQVAESADCLLGYDGLKRNTFVHAKGGIPISVERYPFNNVNDFKNWLSKSG